jgi:hypothetical protein
MNYTNGDKYEGSWVEGVYHGKGKFTSNFGDTYLGSWQNGKCHGYGVETGLNKMSGAWHFTYEGN